MSEQFKWQSETLEETMVGKLDWDVDDYLKEIIKCVKLLDACKELEDYEFVKKRIDDLAEELREFYPYECVERGLTT